MGHEVTVVTGFPRYHLSEAPPAYHGKFLHQEEMAGMKVYRVRGMFLGGKWKWMRGSRTY